MDVTVLVCVTVMSRIEKDKKQLRPPGKKEEGQQRSVLGGTKTPSYAKIKLEKMGERRVTTLRVSCVKLEIQADSFAFVFVPISSAPSTKYVSGIPKMLGAK